MWADRTRRDGTQERTEVDAELKESITRESAVIRRSRRARTRRCRERRREERRGMYESGNEPIKTSIVKDVVLKPMDTKSKESITRAPAVIRRWARTRPCRERRREERREYDIVRKPSNNWNSPNQWKQQEGKRTEKVMHDGKVERRRGTSKGATRRRKDPMDEIDLLDESRRVRGQNLKTVTY